MSCQSNCISAAYYCGHNSLSEDSQLLFREHLILQTEMILMCGQPDETQGPLPR